MKCRIGIDLGGTAIKAGVVDERHQIIHSYTQPTGEGFETGVRNMAEAARRVSAMAGCEITDFPCVGIGLPSCINPHTGRLVFSNNTNWRDVPLCEELEKLLPVPIYIGNDANCAVIGETVAGAAKGRKNVIMLTLGTGVGGGVILNGKLFCGADGMGTELGHTPIVSGGTPCTCGINGCLEAYASVTALIRQTKEAMAQHADSAMHAYAAEEGAVSGKTAFECAKQGDAAAQEVVGQYIDYLANGIGGLVNVFRPEIVLLGGGLSAQGDALLDPINGAVKKYVFASDIIGVPPIIKATLGNAAGTIGAAYLDRM